MKPWSRCAWGRWPAGQLPTSSTTTRRAASAQGSSTALGLAVAHPGPPRRWQRSGWRPGLGPLQLPLLEVVPEAVVRVAVLVSGRRLLGAGGHGVGVGHVGREHVLVLEARHLPHRPHHRLEHGAAPLGHLHPLGQHGAPRAQRRHDEVDGLEGRHREVVAEEAGRAGEGALRPGCPKRDGGHVPAAGAPDLPVPVHQGRVAPALSLECRRGLDVDVTHVRRAPATGRGSAPGRRSPRRAAGPWC